MAELRLQNLGKRFGDHAAVEAVELTVADGEFLALLGPSGCGKTTLLRLIAGFEEPDAGSISIAGREVARPGRQLPPEERRVGLVFQSYALWPHMSVAENVAYPLKVAGLPRAELVRRRDAALATTGLEGFAGRRPADLSGGQRQRVALARCLVMEPPLVLLDEPLANLDVHLRAAMQEEFAGFHDKTGATMVYITHDQAEAMALADRIAVMHQGRLQQVAAPRALYNEPATAMVAGFIGEGSLVEAELLGFEADGRAAVTLWDRRVRLRARPGQAPGPVVASLRPEQLSLTAPDGPDVLPARVRRAVYRGGRVALDLVPEAAPEASLLLLEPEATAPGPGERVGIAIGGGWVIPE
ncbi:iron(III) transport system ATP-binding protein [Tistlia consotensis]|uniref:Carbohydrate ABC transporter ATP-binding protein, CUT1 family n=1 Tax=Tistlia consotensis USBA 355 TaxID=560819 RepID=A0A1Y6C1Q6_9PROT|nr:ABC transporter ATP-binding protein [Tistlia consotensis]SMF39560.1 carbohydrate ABC transporter ATP-binding protein, CUT1 family [Tistlia consotensis USBA 355]SNR36345.1 iron(III) transport system ATP-binding protein [Tistlia consotensis]